MKTPAPLALCAAALALLLPAARVRSQLAPAAATTDPVAALQALQTANDDLLKRQDATIKDLEDMTATAREARILSKRG